MSNNTNNQLQIKNVEFNGDKLIAIKNETTGKIYTGVSYVCKGIGLSKSQKDTQVQNVQSDLILKRGCLKFQAGVLDKNNETICIELEFLPLWLAKISITPDMIKNKPDVVEKLIEYQLKAKDILANAFINKNILVENYLAMSEEDRAIAYFQKSKEKKELEKTLQLQAPQVEMFNKFLDADDAISFERISKLFNIPNMGRNNLFKLLREKEILMSVKSRKNTPYENYKQYFKVIERANDFNDKLSFTTYIKPIGIKYIYKILKKNGFIPDDEIIDKDILEYIKSK